MSWLEPNLRALAALDRALAQRVATARVDPELRVFTARSGAPTVAAGDVLLHNRFDPEAEARRWAEVEMARLEAGRANRAVVLGFGLGYHVEALARIWQGPLEVVEPDLGCVRLACELRDLRALWGRVRLHTDASPEDVVRTWGRVTVCAHVPSVLRSGRVLREVGERIRARAALANLRLKVLVVSPMYGGSLPIARYCYGALRALGQRATLLDLSPFYSAFREIGRFRARRTLRSRLESFYAEFLGAGVLAAADSLGPDVVLAMAQAPLSAAVLGELRSRGIVTAMWFVEDYRRFPYWRELVPQCDYFFAIQEEEVLSEAERLGARACYLPCACDPTVHRPLDLPPQVRAELGAPVAFVGAGYRNRRIAFRCLLDLGLRIWGSDWEGAGELERAIQRGGTRVETEEVVRIFNATAVNLNLHSSTYLDGVDPQGDFVNPRTFELAAAGAFQVVDERRLLPSLFTPGEEVATFGSVREMRELVCYYLERPEERAAMAARARARALGEHTYRHRMARFLETIAAENYDRFLARPREETVGELAAEVAGTPVGDLLGRLPPDEPLSLDSVVAELQGGQGRLSEAEAIFLFLHQFDELYVREHRG